jgi:PKD repeat protein
MKCEAFTNTLKNKNIMSKKPLLLTFIFTFYFLLFTLKCSAQTIPTGISTDSIFFKEIFNAYPNNVLPFYYYKPISYDSLTSPLLFAIHGDGDNGLGSISALENIAESRKALIIAPNVGNTGGWRFNEPVYATPDTIVPPNPFYECLEIGPATEIFKQIYQHILMRENRTAMSSYLIGFSAGGQYVSRYMLLRQAYPDSIPLQMAVSSNAYYYTFPTDSFEGIAMTYMCGLSFEGGLDTTGSEYCPMTNKIYDFGCREDIIQYYNENYAVMIGTADTANLYDTLSPCGLAQGINRYQRAKTFYAFCDTDAVNIGTTLKWQYGEVPGVGHDINAMYNTILAGDSMPLAERLLFETPHHIVPDIAPVASFYANEDTVYLPGATVNFTNTSSLATSYLWDFGDGSTSTQVNPSHTYTTIAKDSLDPGAVVGFSVQLTATNSDGCGNWNVIRHYIVVIDLADVKNIFSSDKIKVYPNPANNIITIETSSLNKNEDISIYSIQGELLLQQPILLAKTNVDISTLAKGLYFIKVKAEKGLAVKKFVKE